MKRLAPSVLVVALALVAGAGVAHAQRGGGTPQAGLHLQGGQPHVGMPFVLDMVVDGFDEQPAPTVPTLTIPDAEVAAAGVEPSVSRSIQIINGRRTDATVVRWVLHWRITPAKEGTLRIPAITAVQGSKKVTADAGEVRVESIPTTEDMKLELALPDRPVFVGETVPVTLSWLFRRDPQEQSFAVPLLGLDAVTVSAPPIRNARQVLEFAAGGKTLQLPYEVDEVDGGTGKYRRIRFTFFLAPRTAGALAVPPSTVAAGLAVGRADFFGQAPSRMFRAVDVARTLEVKPLPQTDKPSTFAGAVGASFSIAARTSRSVVEIGEPVDLEITVKGDQRLDTLALGALDGEGGLPKDKFQVPADPPTGTLSEDGKTKVFKVSVLVTAPTTELPSLAFAYFDPVKGAYQTVHSDPIALSVKGGAVVGAGDVVAASPKKPTTTTTAATPAPGAGGGDVALDGVELALSSPGQAGDRPLGGIVLWLLVGALYAVPLAIFFGRRWQLRTAGQREEAAEVKAARKAVKDALVTTATAPGRDAASALGAALRALARALGRDVSDDDGLLAKIETESFAPGAATAPLSAELRRQAEALAARWASEAREVPRATARGRGAGAAVILVLAGAGVARADALDDGRASYQAAMGVSEPAARKAAFARAARELGEAARLAPDHPELLADWGNAALGAGDVATATLAFRRALALDPGNARAQQNLAWLRGRQPDAFRPVARGAIDALFFFHQWPRERRLLVGAVAFALAILLLVPWRGRAGWRVVAVLPLAVWLAMLASVVLEDRHVDDAVVMESVSLRTADSPGAPAAMGQAVPRGAEVVVVERREGWTRVRIAGGAVGWVPAGVVAGVR